MYFQRLGQGMRQLMAGNRKFALQYIERDDIAAIIREAAEVSGIPDVMDVDKDEVEKILNSWTFLWSVLASQGCRVGFFFILLGLTITPDIVFVVSTKF